MNTTTQSRDETPKDNLLVIDSNGRIMSCRVSQFYGTALLLQMNSMRLRDLHETSLSQTESLTLERIKRAAQAVAPGDNIMFIDDSRRIRSCRINPDYGIALLENLPQNPKEVADCAEAALSYDTAIQSGEASSSKQETRADSSQRPSKQSEPPYINPRILSDHILSTVNRQPYDRDWISKHNVDESCLNGPSSKIKLDVLVKTGAIKAGDLLCVIYELDDGTANLEVGKVLQIPRNPQNPQYSRLDLHVLTHQASIDGILHDCKGATDIVNGMDRQKTNGKSKKLSEPWKMIGVLEGGGRDVGSLWRVRQAYEVFTEAIKEWGERNREAVE